MTGTVISVASVALAAWLLAGGTGVSLMMLVALTVLVIAVTPRPSRSNARSPRPRPTRPAEPPSLREVAALLTWATVSARHFDQATRPMLQAVTAHCLRERTGVSLYDQPDRARTLLGSRVWALVDPGRAASQDSTAPGPDLGLIDDLLNRLERL